MQVPGGFVGLESIKKRVAKSGRIQHTGQTLKCPGMGRISGNPPLPICILECVHLPRSIQFWVGRYGRWKRSDSFIEGTTWQGEAME